MSNNDDVPKTLEDALAQGYNPIRNVDQYIREKLGLSQAEFDDHRRKSPFFLSVGVDCSDPNNLNMVCRRDDGLGIICYCGINKICNCVGR
jgi:hypothetical protein